MSDRFVKTKKNHAQTLDYPTKTHDATHVCTRHGVLEGCCQQSEVWGEQRPLPQKTHTLSENAQVLEIHLRKETHFTFIKNHLLEDQPALGPWVT